MKPANSLAAIAPASVTCLAVQTMKRCGHGSKSWLRSIAGVLGAIPMALGVQAEVGRAAQVDCRSSRFLTYPFTLIRVLLIRNLGLLFVLPLGVHRNILGPERKPQRRLLMNASTTSTAIPEAPKLTRLHIRTSASQKALLARGTQPPSQCESVRLAELSGSR